MATLLALLITAAIAAPLVVPGALALFPRVDLALANALSRLGHWALNRGAPRSAGVVGWVLRNLCATPAGAVLGHGLRAAAAADSGRTQTAVVSAEEMLRTLRAVQADICSWSFVNMAIDVFVNAGRYRRALEAAAQWSYEAQAAGREADPANHAIAQINRAEALHNLGRNAEALASLDALAEVCQRDVLALQGRAVLRAWILAHVNRADEAAVAMESVDPTPFGRRYRAEFFYTQSLIARERGNLEEAIQAARLGLKVACRASSRRNGLVMVAAAEAARGNDEGALALLATAARQGYKGQAAGGLLLQGQFLERHGRRDEAIRCYTRALELDEESYLCEHIRDRQSLLAAGRSTDR